jgi:hypothetical protein
MGFVYKQKLTRSITLGLGLHQRAARVVQESAKKKNPVPVS